MKQKALQVFVHASVFLLVAYCYWSALYSVTYIV